MLRTTKDVINKARDEGVYTEQEASTLNDIWAELKVTFSVSKTSRQ
jgi:hypothetical protein